VDEYKPLVVGAEQGVEEGVAGVEESVAQGVDQVAGGVDQVIAGRAWQVMPATFIACRSTQ